MLKSVMLYVCLNLTLNVVDSTIPVKAIVVNKNFNQNTRTCVPFNFCVHYIYVQIHVLTYLSTLIIYSFHLDHCGALPWFLEKVIVMIVMKMGVNYTCTCSYFYNNHIQLTY